MMISIMIDVKLDRNDRPDLYEQVAAVTRTRGVRPPPRVQHLDSLCLPKVLLHSAQRTTPERASHAHILVVGVEVIPGSFPPVPDVRTGDPTLRNAHGTKP